MDNFETAYKRLNREQKEAVDTIDGPLLVIAGPGTGKTQLLSVRVAHILQETHAAPQNVLCLTFTNKAAHNMRQRLFELIGPTAYEVVVRTFHSFAADIMNEYPDYFWNGARLGVVPDAVQLEVIQDILGRLPLDNPLARRFAGELTGLKDVQDALKLTKEAGLTPDKLTAILTVNVAYIDQIEPLLADRLSTSLSYKKLNVLVDDIESLLPQQSIDAQISPLISLRTVILAALKHAVKQDEPLGKTTNTSKWKGALVQTVDGEKIMQKERERNAWWLELATVYEQYREALHVRGYYDYADMLIEVISQLEQHPELRSDVQERFLYVLIDEFQDTNPAQLRLAHLVADHHTSEGKPNLMVVGDDDQAIYKFNGAELNNMLGFRSFYGVKKPVVLVQNYRSSQAILDMAKVVAEYASDRLVHRENDIIKDLVAARPPEQKGEILHRQYPTRQHQLSAVVRDVARLFGNKTGSVALLARGHESLRAVAALLQSQGVPVRYEQQNDVLEHPAVKQLLLLSETLVAIAEGDEDASNEAMSLLIRHPMWEFDPKDLWQLAIDNRYRPHWLKSMLASENVALQTLANSLLAMAQVASIEPLPLVMEYLLGLRQHESFTSPFSTYFLKDKALTKQLTDTLSAVQLLRTLADEFSYHNEATLSDFMRFIRLNQASKRLVTDDSVFMSGDRAVELFTVHKAKGLEFDTVFIIDGVEDSWKPFSTGRKPPSNLPLQAYGDTTDDYVRLFYVATTRARHSVYVSSYTSDETGKEYLVAPFIGGAIKPVVIAMADAGDPLTVLREASSWPALEGRDEKLLLKPILEDFTLSVTALINFLDIPSGGPVYFKERNLLRLPEAKTVSLAYGTAIHAALEQAQRLQNKDEFDIDEVFEAFDTALDNEHLPREEYKRYLAQGQRVLGTLLESYDYELPKGSRSEQSLTCILPDGTAIAGKLDRVDSDTSGRVVIVDYKTGQPLQNFATKDHNKMIKAWKHRSQLIYYALLAHQDAQLKKATDVVGQMVYVEAGSAKDLIREYTPTKGEIERMTKLATKVWQKIQACDFPNVSAYEKTIEGILQFEEDLLNGTI